MTKTATDPRDAGRKFVGHPCTLNGVPASIGGRRQDFATVAVLPDGPHAHFSWFAVANVMTNNDGRFRA